MEEVYKELEEKGYVEYPIYGYIKRLDLPEKLKRARKELWPHIVANDREVSRQYHAALRTCQNALIQGLSAFVVKEAIVEIDRRLREEGLDAWVAYQVHDEIGVQANVKHAKRVMQIMLECMVREVNRVELDAEPELKRTMSKAEPPIPEEELHETVAA
jgi:DNA polymerase I-like protein with 3'-5' exonuclease and polymerase domains